MQLSLGTALVIVAVLASTLLVIDRERKMTSPFIALGAAVIQTLILFGVLDFLRNVWRIELILPTTQFICAYTVWAETTQKRAITASTVLLSVTLIELMFLLGRLRP
ncbi:MAG: hypothetical protein M4D80_27100 [Myxococcota bacterium]|nr:hypothetical protein [Myxococcota bacterium]